MLLLEMNKLMNEEMNQQIQNSTSNYNIFFKLNNYTFLYTRQQK